MSLLSRNFRIFGLCKTVVSDNGRCFISGNFRRFLEQRGIAQVLTVPYCPFCNGQGEAAVRVVKEQYKSTPASSGADRLQNAVAVLRMVPSGLGVSAALRMFGWQPLTLLGQLKPTDAPEPTPLRRWPDGFFLGSADGFSGRMAIRHSPADPRCSSLPYSLDYRGSSPASLI